MAHQNPFHPPVKIIVDENLPLSELKNKLLAQLDPPAAYKIICLRTGDFLSADDEQRGLRNTPYR
jgi:hypothetical protein